MFEKVGAEKKIRKGSLCRRILLLIPKLLHLNGLDLEDKITRVMFLVSCLLVDLSAFGWGVIFFSNNLGGNMREGIVFFIFLNCVTLFLSAVFVLYVILNIYEILIAATCTALFLSCDFIHFYQNTGALDGFVLSYTSFIPICVLLMSYRKIHKIFWIIVYFVNLVVVFTFEFWWTNREMLAKYILGDTFYILILGCYANIYFPILIFVGVILFFVIATEKKREMVEKITKSIADLDTESKYARKLKLKKLKYCTELERKFKTIINHVESYKCYLPSALIAIKEEESSDGNSLGNSLSSATGSSVIDSVISTEKNFDIADQDLRNIFLKKVNVTLLMCKICNIREFIDKNETFEDYISVHSKFTELVHEIGRKNHGVLHEIFNDKIIISFNAELRCVNHEESCCDASLMLMKGFKKEEALQNVRIQILCISDEMLYGTIGFEMKKKFCFVGENYKRIFEMEERDFPSGKVYVDENLFFGVRYQYVTIKEGKSENGNNVVYEVKEKKNISSGEWIYEIGDD